MPRNRQGETSNIEQDSRLSDVVDTEPVGKTLLAAGTSGRPRRNSNKVSEGRLVIRKQTRLGVYTSTGSD